MVARLERSDNLVRPRDFVDVLSTPWPFRPITIATYAGVTFIPATASELGRLENPSIGVAAGIAAMSVGIAALMLFALKLLLPTSQRVPVPIIVVLLMFIGFFRGTFVATLVDSFGIESDSYFLTRQLVGLTSVPIVLALISLVVSRILTSRDARRTTRVEISTTESTRDRVLDDVLASGARLVAEVDGTVRPAVDEIVRDVSNGTSSRAELANRIDALVSEVIRPLSHALATTGSAFPSTQRDARHMFTATSGPSIREQFSPAFTAVSSFLGGLSVLMDMAPLPTAILAAVTVGVVTYAVLSVVGIAVGKRRTSNIVAVVVVGAIHAVGWIPSHLVNVSAVFPPNFPFNPWVVGVIGSVVLGWIYQLIVLGAYSSRNQLVRLDNARVDMVLQLSEARRRAWLRQRHLTHTLHSTVQSRVHAEARLVRSGTGTLTASERRRVTETVRSVLDAVNDEPPAAVDAVRGIRDTIAFWSGMCDILLQISPDAEHAIGADAEVAEAVNIVALEMISNAIRHGHATVIDVEILRDSPETIRIIAVNNGESVDANYSAGLGMALYDELCAQWEIRGEVSVTIEAVIAARGNKRSDYAI